MGRQRVAPGLFTDIDREWRQKWLKAQQLTKREKAFHFYYIWDNPDFRKARLNPLRRLWQAPGDAFERALRPAMGLQPAFITKWFVGKSLWAYGLVCAATYYAYYNSSDWTTKGGWKTKTSKPMTMPDNPHYPKKDPNLIERKFSFKTLDAISERKKKCCDKIKTWKDKQGVCD